MPERRVREVSRRVVSERVIGSANPVAKWGRDSGSTCMSSIGGFFFGLLLFIAAFALPFFAARTEKDSKDVAKLEVISADQAAQISGKALVSGTLIATSALVPPKGNAGPVAAYSYLTEDYETHPETHTETHKEIKDGKEVEVTEEVTEMVSDWVAKIDETKWAQLKLGRIDIDPQRASVDLPWDNVYTFTSPQGTHRENVTVIQNGLNVLLAAEFQNGQVIGQPDFYKVSTKSKDELVAAMHSSEEGQRWLLIIISIVLWTISLSLIAGPAMILLNVLPVKAIGAAARGVITFVSLIVACTLTWVTYVAVRYWWVIVILLAVAAFAIIAAANKNRKAQPDTQAPA